MIARLICRWFGHKFRRARKDEDQRIKFCRRCKTVAPVKRRKAQ